MAAASKVGGKRKRQQSHSEQDKFLHKSGVLLQREAKKVRAFQVRKVVQQLKQSRGQLETAQKEHQELLGKQSSNGKDGASEVKQSSDTLSKKDKQVKKLQTTVNKLEKELIVFKALDLKAVVARAMETTGLEKKKQLEQQKKLQKQQEEQQKQQIRYGGGDYSDDESDYGRGGASDDDDDGFDSEEYENARKATGAVGEERKDDSGSELEYEDEQDEDAGAEPMERSEEQPQEAVASDDLQKQPDGFSKDAADVPMEKPTEQQKEEDGDAANAKQDADLQLQNMLIDRILVHKQMKPLLEAIEKVLEKEERETEKKLRKQEKKALKRDRNEVLIGGRSSAAPTSLFLGSLSGRGGVIDDDLDGGIGMSSSYMDGAEDDIAEFLGEKKKNRMGQNARRQKAIRMEEAAKRKQDRENGIFRPFGPRKEDALSKYGPSERPKKKKPVAEVQSKNKGSGRSSSKPETEQRRGGGGRERERERGAPSARAAGAGASSSSSRPPPVNAPPKVEPSHPSWIAKQALKEKEKASITAFAGKKITFGDD